MTGALTNHLWQSTVFAFAVALLTLAFRGNASKVRYSLWLAASLKFLLPLSPAIDFAGHIHSGGPAQQIATPKAASAIVQLTQPFPPELLLASPQPESHDWLPLALFILWAGGFAAIVIRRCISWLRIRAARAASTPLPVPYATPVHSSRNRMEPGVVGWWRPVVLLPAGIVECLAPRQFEAVLAHELAHVRRRDNLTAALHMVVEALFWFYPLVWWIGARLVHERERACDESVLSQGSTPRDYAEGILNVCKQYLESPLACVSGVTGSSLQKRVEAIMMNRAAARLAFTKKIILSVAALAALAVPAVVGILRTTSVEAQSVAAGPRFEIASVRECGETVGRGNTKKGPPGGAPVVSPGRLNTGCAALAGDYPIAGLIQRAYGRLGLGHPVALGSALPLSGGPAWIYSAYYIINAAAANKASPQTMEGPMLQALLEDRFKLRAHRETRQVPVYALTVAKGGPRIQRVADDSCIHPDYTVYPLAPAPPGKTYCQERGVGGRKGPNTTLQVENRSIDFFCKLLALVLDRPIVDRTGLPGNYNFHLEFAIDQTTVGVPGGPPEPAVDGEPAPSIFTVVQQELGLKLEPVTGPREFLVIDHIERPSEN